MNWSEPPPPDEEEDLSTYFPAWFLGAIGTAPERGAIEVAGTAIETLAWGMRGRRGLLMLHGAGSHADWWCPFAPFLAADRRVGAISWSGMGRSGWRDTYSLELHRRELIEGADALGLFDGDAKPWIVAHSFGSLPALQVAASAAGERFGGLIVVDNGARPARLSSPFAGRSAWANQGYASLAEGVGRFRLRPPQPCDNGFLLDFIAMRSLVERDDGRWHWCFDPDGDAKRADTHMEGTGPIVAAARIPLVFLWGQHSSLMEPDIVALTRDRAPPGTRFVEMPEAAHHLMLDQPIAFVTALRALLA